MSERVDERPSSAAGGVAIAAVTFVLWGLYPFYFKALGAVHPIEIVAHRILWSLLFLAALLRPLGAMPELRATLRNPRRMLVLLLTAGLILVNWLVYVLAIRWGQVLDASLGYFLGPLVSVTLGVVVLKERLSRVQLAAVLLAAAAVLNLIVQMGVVPKIALFLGISFSIYGLLRKRLPVGPVVGLFIECLLTLPVAVIAFVWLGAEGTLAVGRHGLGLDLLLLASGFVTAGPLLLFNAGAKRVNYATIGVMQYIAPSMLFFESVLVFGEPLDPWRLVTFILIWAGLALYSGDVLRQTRRAG